MASSDATTPDQYIASLPDDRREVVAKVRETINANLPEGFEEGMRYGMIGWYVPLDRAPDTYNGQPLGLAGLASQKAYISLYLTDVYGNRETEAWFKEQFAAAGKTLNMGKSCVRFKRLDQIPLDVIGEAIARVDIDSFLEHYGKARGSARKIRGSD